MAFILGQQRYEYRRPTDADEWGADRLLEPQPTSYAIAMLPGLAVELDELLEAAKKSERNPRETTGRYTIKSRSEPELPVIPPPSPTPPKTIIIGKPGPQERTSNHPLGLPPNLRELIYKAVFQDNGAGSTGLVPLLTCRQFYHEARKLAWSYSGFSLEHHTRALTQSKLSLCYNLQFYSRKVQALRVNAYHLSTLYRLRGSLPAMDFLHVVDTMQGAEDERTYWSSICQIIVESVLFSKRASSIVLYCDALAAYGGPFVQRMIGLRFRLPKYGFVVCIEKVSRVKSPRLHHNIQASMTPLRGFTEDGEQVEMDGETKRKKIQPVIFWAATH
jgi:hypothetical protein